MTGALGGRTVLVTGGGSGLGREIATACAEAGANVVVAAPGANGEATADTIAKTGGQAVWARCDVTNPNDVAAAVRAGIERWGGLDAVVHNATSRLSSKVDAIEDVDAATWEDHAAVSLRGAYHCALAALPFLPQPGGRFILMTSPAGMEGSVTLPLYGVVKAGLRGLAKSLAKEWGRRGIAVNCVSPLAQTDALGRAYDENPALEERLKALVPLGWIGDPHDDVAPAVVFLLSEASRYITGQTLVVDGGRFMGL